MIVIETCPKCGHDLQPGCYTTNPPIPYVRCPACGWSHEGNPEQVVRIPFGGNSYDPPKKYLPDSFTLHVNQGAFANDACFRCPSNPKNGGDGICFCTLGQPVIR